jgi:hypothetical protein
MSMTYRGEVKGGIIVLEPGAGLPDGTIVSVEPLSHDLKPPAEESDALSRMGDLAVETGIEDLAKNVDHYLYGHPKD